MSDRIPLSFLLAEHKDDQPPVEPIPGFAVFYNEELWRLKTMLERTAILVDVNDQYRTITARFEYVLVDPRVVEWQTKTGEAVRTWRRQPTKPPADQSVREVGDKRAIASQERQREREENEREELRRRAREAAAAAALQEPEPQPEVEPLAQSIANSSERDTTSEGVPPILARRRAEGLANAEKPSADTPDQGEREESRGDSDMATAGTSTVEPSSPPAGEKLKLCPSCKLQKPRSMFPPGKGFHACFECRPPAESPLKNQAAATAEPARKISRPTEISPAANPASIVTRPPRHRTRPEGCLKKCRPFRDDVYHAPGCPHRVEQLEKFNRKAPPTPGCKACEAPGRGIRHAVGCPHRRGPLSNAEMVQLAAGTLPTVAVSADPAAQETALALTTPSELAPLPAIDHMPTRDDWLQLLVRLRAVTAENRVLKTSLRELYDDLHEVLDS